LSSSSANFSGTGNLTVALNGPNAGSDYSQLNVTGAVSLASANLKVVQGAAGAVNSHYTILNNYLADAVSGTFAGLAEGATVVANSGAQFTISYHGGSGNDVVLTQTTLPSQPKFTGGQKLPGGAFQVNGTGITNLTYTVQASTNLTVSNWVTI